MDSSAALAKIRQREDAAAAARFHQRQRPARERDQRIRRDVERQPEALATGLHKRRFHLGARRERGAVHDEIERAELLLDLREDRIDVSVRGHVARQDERGLLESLREIIDVFFEAALIGQGEACAASGRGLRDRPRDRPLVGHTNNESELTRKISHRRSWRRDLASAFRSASLASAAVARRPPGATLAAAASRWTALAIAARPGSALSVSGARARVAESGLSRVSLSLSLRLPLAAVAVAVSIVEAAAVLANREIRSLALWYLTLWPRQRRADQRPMYGPFIGVVRRLRLARLGLALA